MLNCFYWYAIIWTIILILYSFDISYFNTDLNPDLLVFLLLTIGMAIVIGIAFRKCFSFKICEKIPNNTKKNVIYIILGYILEFLYAGYIPLISIAFKNNRVYEEFPGIPIFHVLLNGITSYYAIKIFYYMLCANKEEKKYFLIQYILLLSMFLLMYYRSMIVINVFMAMILTISYFQKKKKIKLKHYIIMVLLLLLCYCYGGIGNIRDGYEWNDNSYIENLGLYKSFPKIIPKQFMWTYSYLTTPLSNLNYNINNNNVKINLQNYLSEFFPDFLSKRLFKNTEITEIMLIRTYFNATTGWSSIYVNAGFIGMYIVFIYIMFLFTYGLYKSSKKKGIETDKTIFYAIMNIVMIFMFFYNTLSYVGISLMFYISLFSIIFKKNNKKE